MKRYLISSNRLVDFLCLPFFFLLISILLLNPRNTLAYWQQRADYKMSVQMDVQNYTYSGTQQLTYTNHSPDTLYQIFYHLYFNAFQPGSEMDLRSRNLPDPDPRIKDRISQLKPHEIGYLRLKHLSQDGIPVQGESIGTVYQLPLAKPIEPGATTILKLEFEGQVPIQIRRAGRNNSEGIALSMTQWYPKLAEYDFEGWHADPYIAREFFGVWGDYDLEITIDGRYTVAATGYLQNRTTEVMGYSNNKIKGKSSNLMRTWHFLAPNVHDFAWAADPYYRHEEQWLEEGRTRLNYFYKDRPTVAKKWEQLKKDLPLFFNFMEDEVGLYPYKQYSVIQGGDGGMEYAMATLILGDKKNYGSLLGTATHEVAHAWFQFILASNESKHPWLDEGFATYYSTLYMNRLNNPPKSDPFEGAYENYRKIAIAGSESPMSTHADRYLNNKNYGMAAYSKGALFLNQLNYLLGPDLFKKTMQNYYREWQFKHPAPNDFIRVAEKTSGANLSWYLNDWTRTTNTIDYGIKELKDSADRSVLTLERIGLMPMPLELEVVFSDGEAEYFYIPLRMMYWQKPNAGTVLPDWPWAQPQYRLILSRPKSEVLSIRIDPRKQIADVNRANNHYGK